MISSFISISSSGQRSNFGAFDDARALRLAESGVRTKLRQASANAEPGSSLQINSHYTVGRNGALSLTDATIAANAARAVNANEQEAQPLRADRERNGARLSDFAKPAVTLLPSEQAELFGIAASDPTQAVLPSPTREVLFVRGADGSYYAAAQAGNAATGVNDLARTARESAGLLFAAADDITARQAAYNIARLYAANSQSPVFPTGELQAVA